MSWSLRFEDAVLAIPGAPDAPPASGWVPDGGMHIVATVAHGPTALVRTCLGFQPPRRGRVWVRDVEPYTLPRAALQHFRRTVTAWLLPPALLSNAPLHLNVMLPLLHDPRRTAREAEARAHETLELCGIAKWRNARPSDVPPFVRTRAAVARALAPQPELLLVEDFVARMNRAEAEWALALCRTQARTVVIATSSEDRISSLADSTVYLPQRASFAA